MDLAPSSDDMSYVSETSANDDVGAESGMSVASSSDSDCAIHVVGIPTQTNTVHRMTKSLAFQSHSLFKRSLFLRVFQPVFAGGAASSRSSRGSDSSKSSGAPLSVRRLDESQSEGCALWGWSKDSLCGFEACRTASKEGSSSCLGSFQLFSRRCSDRGRD